MQHCRTAWRIFNPARRFKPSETKSTHKLMNRLAAHACPPGDFWAEPRKRKNSTHQAENSCNYDHARHNKVNTNNSTRSNSPYLEFASIYESMCARSNRNFLALAYTPTLVLLLTFPLFSILNPPKLLSKVPPRTTAPLLSLIPSLSWLMGNLFTHSLSKTKII